MMRRGLRITRHIRHSGRYGVRILQTTYVTITKIPLQTGAESCIILYESGAKDASDKK